MYRLRLINKNNKNLEPKQGNKMISEIPQPDKRPSHERLRELEDNIYTSARAFSDDPGAGSSPYDRADMMHGLAADAGLTDDDMAPSDRRYVLYQEMMRENAIPEYSPRSIDFENLKQLFPNMEVPSRESASQTKYRLDPRIGLYGYDGPTAVMEYFSDSDFLQPSSSVSWYPCESPEEGTAYCEKVGWSFYREGAGEFEAQETIALTLKSYLQIARMKELGLDAFTMHNLESEGEAWIAEVDQALAYSADKAETRYSKTLQEYYGGRHIYY
ncbi:MAG: hypothetical protein LC687_05675 [Actinobacteria bacterium]|nr:hypothetical protein [Actinomycetota bacterium]